MVESTTIGDEEMGSSDALKRERTWKMRKVLVVVLVTLAGLASGQGRESILSRFDPGATSVGGTATLSSQSRGTAALDPGDLNFVPAIVAAEAVPQLVLVKNLAVTAAQGSSAPLSTGAKLQSWFSPY